MTKKAIPASLLDLVRPTLKACTIVTPKKLCRGQQLPATATKFGGAPYAEHSDEWPRCGCGRPLTFVFQWNLAECPHAAPTGARRVYSFYYCFACESWGNIPENAVNAWLVRVHSEASEARAAVMRRPESADDDEVDVHACGAELSSGKIAPSWDSVSESISEECGKLACGELAPEPMWEVYLRATEQLGASAADAMTRVGGFPHWIQGEATPNCSICGKPMEFIAEIGSEDDAGLMWGDTGSVYLFECYTHRGMFEMQLECF